MSRGLPVQRNAEAFLVPHPNGSGMIARVLVLTVEGERATVVELDPILREPRILDAVAKGYSSAVRIWDWAGAAVFWGGVVASFFWNWWTFIPGFAVASIIWRINRRSAIQFTAGAIEGFPERAMLVFSSRGLIWEAPLAALQRDST